MEDVVADKKQPPALYPVLHRSNKILTDNDITEGSHRPQMLSWNTSGPPSMGYEKDKLDQESQAEGMLKSKGSVHQLRLGCLQPGVKVEETLGKVMKVKVFGALSQR